MLTVFPLTFALLAAVLPDADKPAAAILYTVTADEIAKEFKDAPEAAAKKYAPQPPRPKAAGGAIIKISGELGSFGKKQVTLKNGHGIKVVVVFTKGTPPKDGRHVASGTGTFKGFKDKTLTIEVGELKYQRIFGDKE